MCTILLISALLGPLEDVISLKFLPALTGRSISDAYRSLFSFTHYRLGGLSIGNPKLLSDSICEDNLSACCPDCSARISLASTLEDQCLAKSEVLRVTHQAQADFAASLYQSSADSVTENIMALTSEKGLATSWLSAYLLTNTALLCIRVLLVIPFACAMGGFHLDCLHSTFVAWKSSWIKL